MAWSTRSVVLLATALAGCGRVGFDAQDGDAAPVPTIGFAFAQSLTDESVGTHAVEVVLSEPSMMTATVEVSVVGGNAGPADYTLGATRVTMLPGETRADLLITIFDDGTEEEDETIELRLTGATNARVGTADHKVTISANLLPRVSFVTATSMNQEDAGPVAFGVALDVVAPVDVVVAYAVAGTASEADHELHTGMLVIPAGMTAASIDAAILDDLMDELDETIDVSLTAQTGAVIGAVPTHLHTIVDQDPPPGVGFLTATSAGPESSAEYGIRVELDAVSGKTVTVDFNATGGTAGLPADYTLAESPLVFDPGVTQKIVAVTLVGDVIDEDDETAQLTLANPTNATIDTGGDHTMTIQDDDAPPTLQFVNGGAAIPEGTGTYNAGVTLSAPSGRPVQFMVGAGSGTAGPMDYTLNTGPYTLPPGVTSTAVVVTIIQDVLAEPDELFALQLTGATNATIGVTGMQAVTIIDDD